MAIQVRVMHNANANIAVIKPKK